MKKIGIMGGTFNPIHTGHMILAESIRSEFNLDEIWFIPTACSYQKAQREILSPEERFHMVQLAIQDNPNMKCLDLEIRRGGYSYSYQTLEELQMQYPDTEFFFLVGADCLFTLEDWKYPERLLKCCHLIAAVRNGASLEEMEQKRLELKDKFHAQITLFPFLNLEISSTDVRERIRNGKSIRYLVPDCVLSYIVEKGFYKNEINRLQKN